MNTRSTVVPSRVMIVDDDPERARAVAHSLHRAGFETCSVEPTHSGLLRRISDQRPDVILIDMQSPGCDILESLSLVSAHNPTPVVMFSREEDPDYIRQAVAAGVSTYLVSAVSPDRLKPLIEAAVAQFQSLAQLRAQLAKTRDELSSLRWIDRAKAKLIADHKISEDDAYRSLRTEAMRSNRSVAEVARQLMNDEHRR